MELFNFSVAMIYRTEKGKKCLIWYWWRRTTFAGTDLWGGGYGMLDGKRPRGNLSGCLGWCGPGPVRCAGGGLGRGTGSLAGLMDGLMDVMGWRQLLHCRNRFLMGHLSSGGGKVFIPLRRTTNSNKAYLQSVHLKMWDVGVSDWPSMTIKGTVNNFKYENSLII